MAKYCLLSPTFTDPWTVESAAGDGVPWSPEGSVRDGAWNPVQVRPLSYLSCRVMASLLHEGLLLLFRNRPILAPELLRDALRLSLPPWSEARVESAELTQVVPTEYRADLVVLLLEGVPIFAIVVEVQLWRDEDKRKSWPLYLTSLRSRVGCPTALMDRPWRPK